MRRIGGRRRLPLWAWGNRTHDAPARALDIAEVLVSDCEAFLLGTYVEHLEMRTRPVPVWAWTNLLAHGSREDLSAAAADRHGGWSSSHRWRLARALVASEVLQAVRRGATLADLQREVLVPIELAIADHRGARAWTQQRWLDTVRSALRGSRHSSLP